MSSRAANRAKRHGPDLTGDDDNDSDYGNRPSPRKKQKISSSKSSRPKAKKRSRGYAGSDVDEEDEEFSDEEEDELEEISDEDEEDQPIYASGRAGRKSAVTRAKYEEPATDDDLEEEEITPAARRRTMKREVAASDDDDEGENAPHRAHEEQKSLLVKLKVPRSSLQATTQRQTRARTSSKVEQPALEYGLRRSSRATHEDVVFDDRIERTGSFTGTTAGRATRASKRLETVSPSTERLPQLLEKEEAVVEDILTTDLVMEEDAEGEVDDLAAEIEAGISTNVVPESVPGDEDEDEGPIRSRRTRSSKAPMKTVQLLPQRATRSTRRTTRGVDETSDFDPEGEEERPEDQDMSASDHSPNKESQMSAASSAGGRRSGRLAKKRASRRASPEESELDADELAEEAADLAASRMRSGRRGKRHSIGITYDQPKLRERAERKDYRIYRPELAVMEDDDGPAITAGGIRPKKGGGAYRSLFSTHGPFGGTGGPTPMFGNPAAAGGADSDSSDDETSRANKSVGGMVGMTPTAAAGQNLFGQTLNNDAAQAGAPNNLGKVKDRKALADADPLGVDQNVNFDGVGGMEGHINSLKEMVLLPLLYPELFTTLHITPPRGVLFHGPPGTGKTLLARALASSVSTHGQKVTFYMRKGADALSKWVGEAERQLRLLFEEARKNQPSIIFFDEIDGLAPVRSSKQEQIHASIVATLLALMDGMDGRGQVIVIGATNRPDSVDPALRRPGRFDREFYFPLPNEKGRRAIIDIHTKGWEPPLADGFKDQLAILTKGYGGADLRALCTEAALNAIQGTYPQIYTSDDKLLVDPKTIKVLAKDFMISVNKMVPSSERSAPSGAAPLESNVEPLLRDALRKITTLLDDVLPERRKLTALEEAEYDDRDDGIGFEREMMQQKFDRARVFRPRLLVYGAQGMGQSYIGKAILHKFERLHVQSLDLSVLFSDTARSPEATIVQLFNEARRHKPSVIYIPNVDIWYSTVSESVIKLLTGLLRTLPPNEAVLLLGIMELDPGKDDSAPDPHLIKDLFGFSPESHVKLERPTEAQRHEYFETVCNWMAMRPVDFPDLENRKKRQIAVLEKAPVPEVPKKVLTKQEIKAQKKNDRHTLNLLKIRLQAIMEQLKRTYRQFSRPPVDPDLFGYLYDEQDPQAISTDLTEEQRQEHAHNRPFEMQNDDKGVPGILQVATSKFFYNLELITIERRLVNGYYKRPKDFGADIKRLHKDAKTLGDESRIAKADNMRTNVETDLVMLEKSEPALVAECERVYEREQERQRQWQTVADELAAKDQDVPRIVPNVPPHVSSTTEGTLGPISLAKIPGKDPFPMPPSALEKFAKSQLSNGHSSSHSPSQHFSSDPVHREDFDVDMEGTDPYHIEPSETQTATNHEDTQTDDQLHHTQDSPMFRTVPGLTPGYHHSASTTTSGKKSSDKSSGTNGVGPSRSEHPDFSMIHSLTQANSGDSQLPDTQDQYWKSSPEASSQRSVHGVMVDSPQNQGRHTTMPPPAHPTTHGASIASILNPTNAPAPPPARQPVFVALDAETLHLLHASLGRQTSGFSVEQLEQTNAALVDAVWKNRGEWNRNRVAEAVTASFNRVVKEIEDMQKIAKQSQESEMETQREHRYSGAAPNFGQMV